MKKLIVIGCADCVHSDLESINQEGFDYMAIGIDAVNITNKAISYIATYHKEDLPDIKKKMIGKDFKIISHEKADGVDFIVPLLFRSGHKQTSGSSALLGVCWALQNGYDKIILVGCPLNTREGSGKSYGQFWKGWKIHLDKVVGKVKSCSGWTAELLGKPSAEWLENG